MKRLLLLSSLFILVFATALWSASGTPSTLIVKTDANGYLLATAVTQTNPVTQGVFSSRTLRTDSSGSLQVVLTGTVTPTYPLAIPASTCAAPSLGRSGGATTGIAFTATPSILECIAGNAIITLTATNWISTATLQIPDGAAATPALVFASEPTTGFSRPTAGVVRLSIAAVDRHLFTSSSYLLRNDGASITFGAADDLIISRELAAVLQMGADAAGVTNQMFKGPDRITSDGVGGDLTIAGGRNRGASAGGSIIFQTSPAAGAGVTGTLATLLTINNASGVVANATVTGTDFSTAGRYILNSRMVLSGTAPTVTSAGTSPSISGQTTAAFRVNVGTGGTATTIVMAMPTANTGWNCFAENITATAANRANQRVVLQSSTTTAVTVQNQTISTGAALAFTASDIVGFVCAAY